MSNFLSTVDNFREFAANLTAARQDVGSGPGTGYTYLRVNKATGTLTYGPANTPLPPTSRFVVGLHEITHGYIVSSPDRKVEDRNMIPMAHGPRPVPPNGKYGSYDDGGARNATEIVLSSINDPGFKLVHTSWGSSNANRIGTLLDEALVHLNSPDGRAGFVHPVVIIKSGNYKHAKYGVIYHIDFDLVDWLSKDGQTLLSKRGSDPAHQPAASAADEDDDDLTDAERELLGAAE